MNDRLEAQTKQRFASEVFWHFVGRKAKEDIDQSYQILLGILRNGLKVGPEPEPFIYFDPDKKEKETRYGYPVSCLTDIPLKDLAIHAERYGTVAIGFHKERAIEVGFNPVLYVNTYSHLFPRFMKHTREIAEFLVANNTQLAEEFDEMLRILGSVAKHGDLKANPVDNRQLDEGQLNNFYYEREWRSVYDWDFKPSDVCAVIVHSDQMAEELRAILDKESIRLTKTTPILPFRMVYRL